MKQRIGRRFWTLVAISSVLGIASCDWPPSDDLSGPSCPDLGIGALTQPTGAVSYVLNSPPDGLESGWSLLSDSQGEVFVDADFAPQNTWTVPDGTYGMGFDMALIRGNSIDQPPVAIVGFVLEYEFPEYSCDVEINWGTDIELTLPNGICLFNSQEISCQDGSPISVNYTGLPTLTPWLDSIFIEDSQGIGNLPAFEVSYAALEDDVTLCGRIAGIDNGTSDTITETCSAEGAFASEAGTQSKLYIGAQIMMTSGSGLELGRRSNDPDQLSNEGNFKIVTNSGNPEGIIVFTASAL